MALSPSLGAEVLYSLVTGEAYPPILILCGLYLGYKIQIPALKFNTTLSLRLHENLPSFFLYSFFLLLLQSPYYGISP